MRISTHTHAYLDLATAGFLFAFPRLFGASDRLKRVATTLALGKLGYTLLTRHEGGAVGVLPMKAHLALDAGAGTILAAQPFVSGERENTAVTACCVAAGLFDVAAAAVSDPRSGPPVRIPGYNAGVVTRLPGEDAPHEPIPAEEALPETTLLDALRIHLCVTAPTVRAGADHPPAADRAAGGDVRPAHRGRPDPPGDARQVRQRPADGGRAVAQPGHHPRPRARPPHPGRLPRAVRHCRGEQAGRPPPLRAARRPPLARPGADRPSPAQRGRAGAPDRRPPHEREVPRRGGRGSPGS
jgi:hypothetical protein